MVEPLSVVIISKNAQHFIGDAVRSACFADEVLVMDSFSEDQTCEMAEESGAHVIQQAWLGFGRQKNKVVEYAKHDWVFVLDADERITAPLKNEILDVLKNPQYSGFYVPRRNQFFGKDIRFCGLYPDYSIRLFDRRQGRFNDVPVHESVQIKGTVGYLKNAMHHLAYQSVEQFFQKQKRYAQLSEKRKSRLKAVLSPIWTFMKIYFIRMGFLEGWRGLMIAWGYAQYTYWKYK